MALDQARIRFKGKLISVAKEYGGSVDSPDAEKFATSLYDEWVKEVSRLKGVLFG